MQGSFIVSFCQVMNHGRFYYNKACKGCFQIPTTGGPCQNALRWVFIDHGKIMNYSEGNGDFFVGVLKAWILVSKPEFNNGRAR